MIAFCSRCKNICCQNYTYGIAKIWLLRMNDYSADWNGIISKASFDRTIRIVKKSFIKLPCIGSYRSQELVLFIIIVGATSMLLFIFWKSIRATEFQWQSFDIFRDSRALFPTMNVIFSLCTSLQAKITSTLPCFILLLLLLLFSFHHRNITEEPCIVYRSWSVNYARPCSWPNQEFNNMIGQFRT